MVSFQSANHAVLRISRVSSILLLLAGFGCGSSDSLTGPPGVGHPTSANVSGTWVGTYGSPQITECDLVAARAEFQQERSTVDGTLSAGSHDRFCGLGYFEFHGEVRDTHLSGRLTGGLPTDLTVSGSVSSAGNLLLLLKDDHGRDAGGLDLHR
jgi:hypothetical protein